jgi:hypothetical protein
MNTPAGHRANALLARLFQEPELLRRMQTDRDGLFAEAGLSPAERAALHEGSFTSLASIGVHPTLRMHYQMAANPGLAQHVTIREFLPRLLKERKNG